jgi:GR25 family glycosyltransferase involved in LPS biosynthesis
MKIDHIYCINLERSVERRAKMESEFGKEGIEVEFIKAFDARAAKVPGMYGATQSHFSIYRDVVAKGYQNALIFEDDVELCYQFKNKIETLKEPSKWDLLYLHWMDLIPAGHTEGDFILGKCLSTAAYIVSKEACEKMVVFDPMDIHIDFDMKLKELPLNTWMYHDRNIVKAELPWAGDIGFSPDRINKELITHVLHFIEAKSGHVFAFMLLSFLVKFLLRKWIRI